MHAMQKTAYGKKIEALESDNQPVNYRYIHIAPAEFGHSILEFWFMEGEAKYNKRCVGVWQEWILLFLKKI